MEKKANPLAAILLLLSFAAGIILGFLYAPAYREGQQAEPPEQNSNRNE